MDGIQAPPDLCSVAKKKWAELASPDVWGDRITPADIEALGEYCRVFARKAKAEKMVKKHGELVSSPNGFPVQSPWLQIVNKCRTEMMAIALQFGGTPVSRAKSSVVSAGGKKEQRQAAAEAVAGSGNKFAPRSGPRLAVSNN